MKRRVLDVYAVLNSMSGEIGSGDRLVASSQSVWASGEGNARPMRQGNGTQGIPHERGRRKCRHGFWAIKRAAVCWRRMELQSFSLQASGFVHKTKSYYWFFSILLQAGFILVYNVDNYTYLLEF